MGRRASYREGISIFEEELEAAVRAMQMVLNESTKLRRGYLTGAPGVVWKPPNSFRPSRMVTVRALATLLPSLARYPSTVI